MAPGPGPWPMRIAAQRAAIVAGLLAALVYSALAGFGVPAQRTLLHAGDGQHRNRNGSPGGPGACWAWRFWQVPWSTHGRCWRRDSGSLSGPWGALLYVGAADDGGQGRGLGSGPGARPVGSDLASLPILLLVFGQFSLVSPLANFVAIPVVSFVVTPLALGGACALGSALVDGSRAA